MGQICVETSIFSGFYLTGDKTSPRAEKRGHECGLWPMGQSSRDSSDSTTIINALIQIQNMGEDFYFGRPKFDQS